MEINVHQSLAEISHAIEIARIRDQIDVIALPREELKILLDKILGHATVMGLSRAEAMQVEWIRFKGIYFVIVEDVEKDWRPEGQAIEQGQFWDWLEDVSVEEDGDPDYDISPVWMAWVAQENGVPREKYQQWIRDFVRFKTRRHGKS